MAAAAKKKHKKKKKKKTTKSKKGKRTAAKPTRLNPASLSQYADELLEVCSREKLSLGASLKEVLPKIAEQLDAIGAFVHTQDEDLKDRTFTWGVDVPDDVARPRTQPSSVKSNGAVWLVQPLDLAGTKIGTAGFAFETGRATRARLPDCIDAFCEELDGILSHIHTAALKQEIVESMTRALSNRVLRDGLDGAVSVLHAEIGFGDLAICFRDEINPSNYGLQYRIYKGSNCTHDAESSHHRILRAAIEHEGDGIIDPEKNRLAEVLGLTGGAVESVLISGVANADTIGKIAIAHPEGLNTFSRDLLRIFAGVLTQRLVDYRRERLSLARFFEPGVVSHLLRDPNYREKHLKPRVEEIAILFADINGFTRLCEHALSDPGRVGEFVDRWSAAVVQIAWARGGVFDKMVGDCVIALFGPPFFSDSASHRAESALETAREIQNYTVKLGKEADIESLTKTADLPGLAVGVGLNLCSVAVGLFGPNEEYTAFGNGMNECARLQSEAKFKEILVMASMHAALAKDGRIADLKFDGPQEARVKNVPEPLRYFKLVD